MNVVFLVCTWHFGDCIACFIAEVKTTLTRCEVAIATGWISGSSHAYPGKRLFSFSGVMECSRIGCQWGFALSYSLEQGALSEWAASAEKKIGRGLFGVCHAEGTKL
ncbi:hypothetical protein EI42_02839 [Thermosporothrix hazakensis]|uniref:Uncharacterized protein n=1 Tax=Thermosporothrix hazakensis TaxID=644383 RepID=A0A326UG42_THEHA|nr:hypothetical protein EI42_02839 [Thermosporothrix hazakensis]GCE45743.1 hypothetical protein KTH_06120 [Thermosporothrix hazakensis]